MASAVALATAMAVIRPGYAIGADLHKNRLFIEKRCISSILVISGPSGLQKWIRLEILRWKMVLGVLETPKLMHFVKIHEFMHSV